MPQPVDSIIMYDSTTDIEAIRKSYQQEQYKILNSSPVTHLSPDDYQALKIAEAIDRLLVLPPHT